MRTKPSSEPPRICVALDVVMAEAEKVNSAISNRSVGKAIGVSDVAVGRWRKNVEPTRDDVLALEKFLGLEPGHVSRVAGYVAEDEAHDIPTMIAKSNRYTTSGRRVMLRVDAEMAEMAREQAEEAKARRRA